MYIIIIILKKSKYCKNSLSTHSNFSNFYKYSYRRNISEKRKEIFKIVKDRFRNEQNSVAKGGRNE